MKMRRMLLAAFAVLLIFTEILPARAEEGVGMPAASADENAAMPELTSAGEDAAVPELASAGENVAVPELAPADENAAVPELASADENAAVPELASVGEKTPDVPEEPAQAGDESAGPEEPPAFSARVEYSPQGYVVKGTFTEFTSDMVLVQPMYSLDGESYLPCGECWDLPMHDPEAESASENENLQNQLCLYSNSEPLKSYLAGELDLFYLKLCITRENETSYETQTAVIDRGSPQPLPEEISVSAIFDYSVRAREMNPFRYFGRYQITVSEDAAPEEIAAYLPDTLPVEVSLQIGGNAFANGVVDCPITWKPLSIPSLVPGECVNIPDAAEAVSIPAGTLLHTPLGIFQMEEALGIDAPGVSDEINLVLNVVARDEVPSGVLSEEREGLEVAFHLKPTGAVSIQAYVCSDGAAQWSSLPERPFLDAVNAQPCLKNSGYTLVLDNESEPYRSYLAQMDGGDPVPFFIGLKIEGGVYDGKQLVLAWPDSYDLPIRLPELGGAGGNENNAGSGNKNDSTDEGQRPNLPQKPADTTETQTKEMQTPIQASGTNAEPETPQVPKPEQPDTKEPNVIKPEPSDTKEPNVIKPEPSDTKEPNVIKLEPSDTKAPNISKPEPSDTKAPNISKPEPSDSKGPDVQKPEPSEPKEPDESKLSDLKPSDPKGPSASKPKPSDSKVPDMSGREPSASEEPNGSKSELSAPFVWPFGSEQGRSANGFAENAAAKNSAAGTKTGIAINSAAEAKTGTPTAEAAGEKNGGLHTPASSGFLSNERLYNEEDTLPGQNGRTETDARNIRSARQEIPEQSQGNGSHWFLIKLIAAAAFLSICIAAAVKLSHLYVNS